MSLKATSTQCVVTEVLSLKMTTKLQRLVFLAVSVLAVKYPVFQTTVLLKFDMVKF